MPPFLPRKRLKSDSPEPTPPPKRTARHLPTRRGRESVFKDLDAPSKVVRSLSQAEAILGVDEDSSESSDEDTSGDEFEDVQVNGLNNAKGKNRAAKASDDSESEEEDWEDALGQRVAYQDEEPLPEVSGDLALTISASAVPTTVARSDGKKGPTKIQRHIRNITHCIHVQFLMFHNLLRNAWIEDKTVQRILVEKMSAGCWRELDMYWKNAGIVDGKDRVVSPMTKEKPSPVKSFKDGRSEHVWQDAGTKGVQTYGGSKKPIGKAEPSKTNAKQAQKRGRTQRDWGGASDPLEPGQPNLSAGDPLLRLLKYLSAFWKSKFTISAPSLRKRGYLAPAVLEAEINAWRENPDHPDLFGERIENIEAFRNLARKCTGSRDVGEQLFTALLRGIGIEARLVASLQPVGFAWSQNEEGKPKNLEKMKKKVPPSAHSTPLKKRPLPRESVGTQGSPIDLSDDESSGLSSAISISSESEVEEKKTRKTFKNTKTIKDPSYSTYWTEVISHLTHTPIAVSLLPRTIIASSANPESLKAFYCGGAKAEEAKQVFAYLIAFSSDGTAKDVTTRYLPNRQWPGRTKGVRMSVEKVPIYNRRGKVKKWEEFDWFKSVMRPYAQSILKRKPWDEIEDEGDLVPRKPEKPKDMDEEGGKETLQGYKTSKEYVLERHLKREEALKPGANIVRYFVTGKGDNEKQEPVYRRKDVVSCKTVESWHKEGRAIREGEQPLKFVPMRAVTVVRKREIEERERVEGQKVKQGLYSKAQTDWIIPDPIQDGKIPRNAFGNIDVYVPTMVPRGAVHIPLRGTAKVCRKLNIDYAEACTGFEFGKQRAVPVITGVVVAVENEHLVIDAWEEEEAAKAKREHDKREKLVLGLWKKFTTGLRIVERMKREYGDDIELPAPRPKPKSAAPKNSEWDTFQNHTDFEGGFLRDDPGPSEHISGGFMNEHADDMGGGFFPASQDSQADAAFRGELTIDHGEKEQVSRPALVESSRRTPISLHSALQQPKNDIDNDEISTAAEESEDQMSDPVPQKRQTRTKPPTSRGRNTRRGATRTSTRRKPVNDSDIDDPPISDALTSPPSPEQSSIESSADEADDDQDFVSLIRQKTPTPPPAKSTPKRRAARKSEVQIKSHFFDHDSDDETDLTDRSPQKNVKDGGGRGGARGRGRGRARGRGRGKAKG